MAKPDISDPSSEIPNFGLFENEFQVYRNPCTLVTDEAISKLFGISNAGPVTSRAENIYENPDYINSRYSQVCNYLFPAGGNGLFGLDHALEENVTIEITPFSPKCSGGMGVAEYYCSNADIYLKSLFAALESTNTSLDTTDPDTIQRIDLGLGGVHSDTVTSVVLSEKLFVKFTICSIYQDEKIDNIRYAMAETAVNRFQG